MVKVSVIIPVYNAEKYLPKLLDSILNQSMKELEVICVDDGSKDGSLELLNAYKEKDERVVVLSQKNQYAGAARNNGLRHAKGEYVHFMDADDWVYEGAYEKWYAYAKAKHADMCFGKAVFEGFDGSEYWEMDYTPEGKGDEQGWTTTLLESAQELIFAGVTPWAKIYRREFLNAHQIVFDHLICANDRSFYFHTIAKAEVIAYTRDKMVHHYRGVPGALTGVKRLQNYDCHFKSFERVWALYEGFSDDIKRMIILVSVRDMLIHYRKAWGTQYEEPVRKQLSPYLRRMDTRVLRDEDIPADWCGDYFFAYYADLLDSEAYVRLKTNVDRQIQHTCGIYQRETALHRFNYDEIATSLSFKIGRVITAPLRKARDVVRGRKN